MMRDLTWTTVCRVQQALQLSKPNAIQGRDHSAAIEPRISLHSCVRSAAERCHRGISSEP